MSRSPGVLALFGSVGFVGFAASAGACLLEFDPSRLDESAVSSGDASVSSGSAGSCGGCLDAGVCVAGDVVEACGIAGATCQACGPATTCTAGRCVGGSANVKLALGSGTTMAIEADGTLWAWGDNRAGQLAIGETSEAARPTRVSDGWSRAALGGEGSEHACATKSDGSLWCWGNNGDGQLGSGDEEASRAPVRVGGEIDWTSIAVGRASTCAIRANGSLWCWGWNGDGRLGVPGIEGSNVPIPNDALSDWSSVALTFTHACALRDDTSCWCWGSNGSGELARDSGGGDDGDGAPPGVLAAEATGWARIVAGSETSCGLRTDGALWCWGRGDVGQLGFEGGATRPTQVGEASDWTDVSAGGAHACGVRGDGTLHCWGSNEVGQLGSTTGMGTAAGTMSPTRVGDQADWVDVECGHAHTCAVDGADRVFCFGSNGYGELGIGALSSGVGVPMEVPLRP